MTSVVQKVATRGGLRLVVLGGGLSGLSFVHYLRNFMAALDRHDYFSQVTILEAQNYMGGSLKTNRFDDGVVHELGPRSIRLSGFKSDNTLALLDHIGLANQVVFNDGNSKTGTSRFIYCDGKMHLMPTGLTQLHYRLPGSKTRYWSAAYRDLYKTEKMNLDPYPERDPPLYDFIQHRFGTEAAEKVLDPMMRGITAGDARKLSTRALFGDLIDKEQTYGSLIKGVFKPSPRTTTHDELFKNDLNNSELVKNLERKKAIGFNLKTGVQTIPEYLSNSLLNTNQDGLINIYNQTKVVSVKFDSTYLDEAPCTVVVETLDGEQVSIPADHIISALPSKELAKLLPKESTPKEQLDALEDILQIDHVPVGCVCLEYRDLDIKNLPNSMRAFGFLTQSKAGRRVLGISYDSMMFPNIGAVNNSFRMTCMMGGAWFEDVFKTKDPNQVKDAQMEQIALEEVRDILGIKNEPFRVSPWLWKTGIAQYAPGHVERLRRAREKIENMSLPLTLLGQSYDGVAVNDIIFSARTAAYKCIKTL